MVVYMSSGPTAGASPIARAARSAVAAHRGDRGALLPILHDIQAEFGYVDKAVVPILAEELYEHAKQAPGVEVEQVFCFGNCALGPAVEVGGRLRGRVDAARLDALVAEVHS